MVRCRVVAVLTGSVMPTLLLVALPAFGQGTNVGDSVDPVRLKEIHTRLGELKKLQVDMGPGHPRVQEQMRKIKQLEEELVAEQSYVEQIASQLQKAENDLRKKQTDGWKSLSEIQTDADLQSIESIPSPETIEQLERACLTELQRIEWDLASYDPSIESKPPAEKSGAEPFQADQLRLKAQKLSRDSVQLKLKAAQTRHASVRALTDKSPGAEANKLDSELTVKLLTLELQIAEAQVQAAELELAAKRQSGGKTPALSLSGLKDRQKVVQAQLQTLQKQKSLAHQIGQIRKTNDQLADQIREIEMQRFQHQSKSVEHQALLGLVHQALNPQAPSSRSAPKSLD